MFNRFSASTYCFALVGTFISLLWVTSPSKEEADLYKTNLDEYRWIMRLSSRSAEFLERAISMLATSTGVLMKELSEPPGSGQALNRYLRRANVRTKRALSQSDIVPHSAPYQSESEMHDDTSTKNLYEETPSELGAPDEDWNIQETWFSTATNDAGTVFGTFSNVDAYLQSISEFESAENQ